MKIIYLDTKVWNLLAAEDIDHVGLSTCLNEQGACLSIGNFNRVELEQTYLNGKSDEQAQHLLNCLLSAQSAGALYIKDPIETIVAEMWALKNGGQPQFLYNSDERQLHLDEIGRRRNSEVDRLSILRERKIANQAERAKLADYLVSNVTLREELRGIARDGLKKWTHEQSQSAHGISVLTDILSIRFPEISRGELTEYARELVMSPIGRASRAITRANLYVFWRFAAQNKLGQPATRSLFDDTYHLVNAAYCDSYVTCDGDQKQYSDLILPADCKFTFLERSASAQDLLSGMVYA